MFLVFLVHYVSEDAPRGVWNDDGMDQVTGQRKGIGVKRGWVRDGYMYRKQTDGMSLAVYN